MMRHLLFVATAIAALAQPVMAATVAVQAHITVYRNGGPVDHYPGDTFDATAAEIAQLLPIGAITLTGAPGLTGVDFSVNAPALPAVGANFGASGPYANWVLVKTVAADPARVFVDVENTSGAPIVVERDDGTAAAGATPANASLVPLIGGPAPGSQAGAYASTTFKGRLQIYAPTSTAFVTIFKD